jgi:cytochrome P450
LQIICDMMGIPPADERRVFEITNVILGPGDPDLNLDFAQFMTETKELYDYAVELGKDRLANPRGDIATTLMQAEVDGERLELEEFAKFMILLAAAGNETTRNAISHGMKLLTDNPDQRRIWMDDFAGVAPTAVDEIVRLASPVLHMRRLTTEDVEIGGQQIGVGEKVVMWYYSANRDETVFTDPLRFDVRRKAEQVGYGGGGPHFCLGANLARREMTVMFEELFRTLPDLHITSEPQMLRSNFIHGIKKMQCEFTPVAAG